MAGGDQEMVGQWDERGRIGEGEKDWGEGSSEGARDHPEYLGRMNAQLGEGNGGGRGWWTKQRSKDSLNYEHY